MNIKIHSLHFDADVKLLQFIESKINKLDHFYDSIIGAEVTLRIEHSNDAENKVIETKILIPGNDLFSKRQAKTFEEATDIAAEALKQQLKKMKEKQRNK